jgi:hypothetical protein
VEQEYNSELTRQAFGSTSLTSDYDLSISGVGAEQVVIRFNQRFRSNPQFGVESGTLFDTNVYTNPVYEIVAGVMDADTSLLNRDDIRQFMYDQMAMVKYMQGDQWADHVQAMLDAALPGQRVGLERLLNEVAAGQATARNLLDQRMAAEADPSHPDTEARVKNDL